MDYMEEVKIYLAILFNEKLYKRSLCKVGIQKFLSQLETVIQKDREYIFNLIMYHFS